MVIEFPHAGHAIQMRYEAAPESLLVRLPASGKVTRDGVPLQPHSRNCGEVIFALEAEFKAFQEEDQCETWTFDIWYQDRGNQRHIVLKLFCINEEWEAHIEMGEVLLEISLDSYDDFDQATPLMTFRTDLFGPEVIGKA